MLPVTSITETSVLLLITAVAVHGSLVILNKHPVLEYLLSISSMWHWSYRKCFRMVSKHCFKDDLDSELPSYHGYWALVILDMAFAWLHASPFPVPVSITFVLCNDLDRAAPKSLANFTAAANFYLLMTAPMTSVFAFSPISPRTSLSGEMAMCKFYV